MFSALSNYVKPKPTQVKQREAISLEDLGIPDLKQTASLSAVLAEDVQMTAEQAIQQANPGIDFSDAAIDKAKKFVARADDQIERCKNQIEEWLLKKADIQALMPLFNAIIKIRRKGNERDQLKEALFRVKKESLNDRDNSTMDTVKNALNSLSNQYKPEQIKEALKCCLRNVPSPSPSVQSASSSSPPKNGCENCYGCSECESHSKNGHSSSNGSSSSSSKRKFEIDSDSEDAYKENRPLYVGHLQH